MNSAAGLNTSPINDRNCLANRGAVPILLITVKAISCGSPFEAAPHAPEPFNVERIVQGR